MNIFLDSSVAVAASLSATGASREVFNHAARQGWRLLVSLWVLREVRDNLANKPPEAAHVWGRQDTRLLRNECASLTAAAWHDANAPRPPLSTVAHYAGDARRDAPGIETR